MNGLNNNNLNIKLTYKASREKIEFLDILFQVDENGFVHSDLFRKETSVNSFLHGRSAHPHHMIDNIPTGLFLRARRICSDLCRFELQARDLNNRFLERGYKTRQSRKVTSAHNGLRGKISLFRRYREGPKKRYVSLQHIIHAITL